MRTTLAPRSGPAARLAGTLLAALALCACGSGDSETGDRADPPGASTRETRTLASSLAPAKCPSPPPPAVDTTLFSGPWAALHQWMLDNDVTFADATPDSTIDTVSLQYRGPAVRMKIVSEARTYCLNPDSLAGTTRIAGVYVLLEPVRAWDHDFLPNDSIFLFVQTDSGSAVLAYAASDSVARAPDPSWSSYYCRDGHFHDRPQGKWRRYPTSGATGGSGVGVGVGAAGDGDQDEDDEVGGDPGGTYGWMACASGCCQFYIPPPVIGDPPGNARERAKGRLPTRVPPDRGYGRPPCIPAPGPS